MILDLYGTNHNPRIWDYPEVIRPERFHGWDGRPFTIIPRAGRAGPLVPRQGAEAVVRRSSVPVLLICATPPAPGVSVSGSSQ